MPRALLACLACLALAAPALAQLRAPGEGPKSGTGLRMKPATRDAAPGERAPRASDKPDAPRASDKRDAPRASDKPDPARIEEIAACMLPGLPESWTRAWVVVDEIGATHGERTFEASFFYADSSAPGRRYAPRACPAQKVAQSVYALNEYLPDFDSRQWSSATLAIGRDGRYELKYDYAPRRPKAEAERR